MIANDFIHAAPPESPTTFCGIPVQDFEDEVHGDERERIADLEACVVCLEMAHGHSHGSGR